MRWLVGADLGTRSEGALQAAAWMAKSATGQRCELVHVVEPAPRLRSVMIERAVETARGELAAMTDRLGLHGPLDGVDAVVADSAEEGLADRAEKGRYDVLLLGRAAPRSSDAIVRLGPVARRLLRRLPVAVGVVPPDLTTADVGAGRIVLGTDLTAASVAAGMFAARLARELRRDLVAMYVHDSGFHAPTFDAAGDVVLPSPSRPALAGENVARWVREHDFRNASPRYGEGPVADALLACAREEDAPIVVVGSRMLSPVQRVFKASVGSDLARLGDRMVIVVPSGRS